MQGTEKEDMDFGFSINNESGITLIELIMVVSIIAIMAGFAALGMDIVHRERVSSATKEMYADLQRSRMDGMVTGATGSLPYIRGAGIRFESPTRYVTFKFNDCNQNYTYEIDGCAGAREESEIRTITMPSSIEIKRLDAGSLVNPANVTADDIPIFDKFGMPRTFEWSVISSYIIVVKHQSAGYAKCIVIDTNSMREGSWDGSTNTCTLK